MKMQRLQQWNEDSAPDMMYALCFVRSANIFLCMASSFIEKHDEVEFARTQSFFTFFGGLVERQAEKWFIKLFNSDF